MYNYEVIDYSFYNAKYGNPKSGDYNEIWEIIKNSKDILLWAINQKEDIFEKKNTVNGIYICEAILLNYANVDNHIYQLLINMIYSSEHIARIISDGSVNRGNSFLLMSLFNPNLILTKEQKMFAVKEAMNKIGTTKYKKIIDDCSKKMDDDGITNDKKTTINIDGCINVIGEKSKQEYINYLFTIMSDTQAHGNGYYDIRYWILKNNNWTKDEKQKLIKDFWFDDEDYDEALNQWELGVFGNEYFKNVFDDVNIYDFSYNDLYNGFHNKNLTDQIFNEIQFCRLMHELRPSKKDLISFTGKNFSKKSFRF